ncbi:MAG TPA: signal peptidase II, partial [Brevundimonas sp.]|nr:signal peptidase II [Brevundimonas sp.]
MNLPRISYAAYGFALTIIIVDQLTKAWVLARLGTTDLALIPNGFRLLDIWPPYLRFG